ncbi:MAG: hypothetical protein JWR69_4559 [Pedosphaera sp.]|nr:hypothetical protein [Pedosphaera sp.]
MTICTDGGGHGAVGEMVEGVGAVGGVAQAGAQLTAAGIGAGAVADVVKGVTELLARHRGGVMMGVMASSGSMGIEDNGALGGGQPA